MAEVVKIEKMTLETGGKIYEMDSSGGGITPGVPIPADTVDTNAIIDGSVQEQDLNDSVKGRMTVTHDASTGGLRIGGYAQAGNVPADNTQSGGTGGFPDEMEIEEGD